MEQKVPAKRHAVSTDANFKVFGTGSKGKLKLKNISTSGARFRILKNLQNLNPGDLVFISIFHENLADPMQVYAEVVWVKDAEVGVKLLSKAECEQRHQRSRIV